MYGKIFRDNELRIEKMINQLFREVALSSI